MEARKFEVTIVSADSLPDVRRTGKMKVYAVVSVDGCESETSKSTKVDMEGETNPRWNFPVEYMIVEAALQQAGVDLVVKLFCKRTLGDRYIGQVKIPVKSLFDMGIMAQKTLSYTVPGTRGGTLNILYSFGQKFQVPAPAPAPAREHCGRRRDLMKVGLVVLVKGTAELLQYLY